MGFLDSLLKKEARKIISGVVDNINGSVNSGGSMNSSHSDRSRSTYVTDPDEEDCCYEESVVRRRVEKVAEEEWSGYELRKNISAREMKAGIGARKYSYGLYLDGVPKAMILILTERSHYRKKDVVLAHQACQEQGVYCMNLMLHLPNRRSYISRQLRNNVR